MINMIVHQAAENANRQRILFEEIKRRLNITNVVIMNADSKTGEVKWDETTP